MMPTSYFPETEYASLYDKRESRLPIIWLLGLTGRASGIIRSRGREGRDGDSEEEHVHGSEVRGRQRERDLAQATGSLSSRGKAGRQMLLSSLQGEAQPCQPVRPYPSSGPSAAKWSICVVLVQEGSFVTTAAGN